MCWRRSLSSLLALCFFTLLSLSGCAIDRPFLFHPNTTIEAPAAYGLAGFEDITLRSGDGVHVHVWSYAARNHQPTIVYFHGNGGNLANRAVYLETLAREGYGVIALDYRGYGKSEGSPSEEGFYEDGRAAITFATQRQPLSHLVLYGESIGTGVAVQMALEYPTAALVLQSAFTSIEARARDHYFWLPLHSLLVDRFDSLSKIALIHQPLLILHGQEDESVPVSDARSLFAAAHEPKKAVYFAGSGHDNLPVQGRLSALSAFLRQQKLRAN